MPHLIAVTGCTGGIGGRVATRLAARGAALRLIARDPRRAPSLPGAQVAQAAYDDGDALRRAFDGADTALFVSAAEHPDRVGLHRAVVEALAHAGVQRVVYTSFVNAAQDSTFTFARDHWHTENLIRGAGLRHTFLRDSLYLDFLPFMAGDDGVIRGPAGDGRFAPVARDDIADVAAVILGDDAGDHDGRTYDLTGPELISMEQAAERLSRATGRTITYHNESLDEAYASRAAYGAPAFEVEGWVTSYAAIANGELEVVSDAVERVAGHPPTTIDEMLATDAGR